ncbi:hypothetical protein ABH923_002504 [Leifsonia sp. EB41]
MRVVGVVRRQRGIQVHRIHPGRVIQPGRVRRQRHLPVDRRRLRQRDRHVLDCSGGLAGHSGGVHHRRHRRDEHDLAGDIVREGDIPKRVLRQDQSRSVHIPRIRRIRAGRLRVQDQGLLHLPRRHLIGQVGVGRDIVVGDRRRSATPGDLPLRGRRLPSRLRLLPHQVEGHGVIIRGHLIVTRRRSGVRGELRRQRMITHREVPGRVLRDLRVHSGPRTVRLLHVQRDSRELRRLRPIRVLKHRLELRPRRHRRRVRVKGSTRCLTCQPIRLAGRRRQLPHLTHARVRQRGPRGRGVRDMLRQRACIRCLRRLISVHRWHRKGLYAEGHCHNSGRYYRRNPHLIRLCNAAQHTATSSTHVYFLPQRKLAVSRRNVSLHRLDPI